MDEVDETSASWYLLLRWQAHGDLDLLVWGDPDKICARARKATALYDLVLQLMVSLYYV